MPPESSVFRRLAAAAIFLGSAVPARAYRPFVSSDAAVAEPRTLEFELGYLGVEHRDGADGRDSPQAVINYGLRDRLEAVGEFAVQRPQGRRSQIVDAALNLKGLAREGVLQAKSGPSVALESSLLLPESRHEDVKAGFEQTVIVSLRAGPAVLHLNLGGGYERSASLPFGVWGLVAETPAWKGVRAALELNGEETRGGTPDNSGLVGVIWDTGWKDLSFDAGGRRGLSAEAADWTVTAGFSIPWRL